MGRVTVGLCGALLLLLAGWLSLTRARLVVTPQGVGAVMTSPPLCSPRIQGEDLYRH